MLGGLRERMYVKHLEQMLGTEQELDKCYILLTYMTMSLIKSMYFYFKKGNIICGIPSSSQILFSHGTFQFLAFLGLDAKKSNSCSIYVYLLNYLKMNQL